jgi:DNA polymerase III subunit chi
MENKPSIKVTFYLVKDNHSKIQLICDKAQEAFRQEKRLLIAVPTFQAAQYIDALLWRLPEESFIPHVIADTPTSEWIAITLQEVENVNKAVHLLNLCPMPTSLYQQVEEIYDLFDETHPEKRELSQQRFQFYQSKGLIVNPSR